jgi:adenylate cyclase
MNRASTATVNTVFNVRVFEQQRVVFESADLSEPVEVGRQERGEEDPYCLLVRQGGRRLIIARAHEDHISRKQLLIEPLPGGRCRLTNLGRRIWLQNQRELGREETCDIDLPYTVSLGDRAVSVEPAQTLHSLRQMTPRPAAVPESGHFPTMTLSAAEALDLERVFQWLHAVMDVLQTASSSSEFLEHAAEAALESVALDSCRVLLRRGDDWHTEVYKAVARLPTEPNWPPSRRVLVAVGRQKKTVWELPEDASPTEGSLAGVRAVVAAPILDARGEVIGALYGDRHLGSNPVALPKITELEAMLVELLACGVAAGLAREEQERRAIKAQVQFEQFFTPELARQLTQHPDLLQGQDAEVTVLFCDLRGFSAISELLGPTKTFELIGRVMDALSDCAFAHGGVVVDYIGDALLTMWGAPDKQPDHAVLACRAALAMLDKLPQLNAEWQPIMGQQLCLGIGIDTGRARVGNTGSHRKFKYGPLGNTVNLASRVQGASKYLKSSFLITGSTRAQLGSEFDVRRLSKVRVVNIDEPVDLYEVSAGGRENFRDRKNRYEQALDFFEKQDYNEAARILGTLLADYPGEGPSLVLLSRTVNAMLEGTPAGHPVWELPGK